MVLFHFIFWCFGSEVCQILAPQLSSNLYHHLPPPQHWKASSNLWTTRKSQAVVLKILVFCKTWPLRGKPTTWVPKLTGLVLLNLEQCHGAF